jgi:hypothetical protein
MTIRFNEIRKQADDLWVSDNADTDALNEAIEETENKMSESQTIIEWFNSPFISDFDKKKALEEINKLKI